MKKVILSSIIAVGLVLFPHQAFAACDFHTLMTAATKNISNFGSTCTITAVEGIDNPGGSEASTTNTAALTLGSGASVTINNGGSLVTGSLTLSGGSIAIQSGGEIKIGSPLYIVDSDADGYVGSYTLYTATASGRRRLGLMRSFTATDCGDASYSTSNQCCVVGTYYADVDGDGYGAGAPIQMCPAAGYVANNTDCYDANPATTNAELAYPGSATCSSAHRGDGSFDYNCSNTATKCGTNYDRATTTSSAGYTDICGSCNNCNVRCCGGTTNYYATATINCGQAGGVCTNATGCQGGSCTRSAGEMCAPPKNACEDYHGSAPTCNLCITISSGTQACQ